MSISERLWNIWYRRFGVLTDSLWEMAIPVNQIYKKIMNCIDYLIQINRWTRQKRTVLNCFDSYFLFYMNITCKQDKCARSDWTKLYAASNQNVCVQSTSDGIVKNRKSDFFSLEVFVCLFFISFNNSFARFFYNSARDTSTCG